MCCATGKRPTACSATRALAVDKCRRLVNELNECGTDVECRGKVEHRLDELHHHDRAMHRMCVTSCKSGRKGDRCRFLHSRLARCPVGEDGHVCRRNYKNKLRKLRSRLRYSTKKDLKQSKRALKDTVERRVPHVSLIEADAEADIDEVPLISLE